MCSEIDQNKSLFSTEFALILRLEIKATLGWLGEASKKR